MYAILGNAIVVIVFASVWKYRFLNFIAVSALIWVSMLCLHLSLDNIFKHFGYPDRPFWLLYILGAPLQVLECIWGLFRSKMHKKKHSSTAFLEDVKDEIEDTKEEE